MRTVDLGTLTGDVMIFGGPYSNLHALRALIGVAQAAGIGPGNMIGTGDVAAYCADGEACVALLEKLGVSVVAGNCERQLSGGAETCDCGFDEGSACSVLARSWYARARNTLSPGSLAWMARCPDRIVFHHNARRYGVVHGAPSSINGFVWPTAPTDTIRAEFRLFESQLGPVDTIICGHSGLAFVRAVDGKTWLNAGTVGLPENDGDTRTRYALLSRDGIAIRHLGYDFKAASQAMEAAGLTEGYQTALVSGYWPSEDTLPRELRRAG